MFYILGDLKYNDTRFKVINGEEIVYAVINNILPVHMEGDSNTTFTNKCFIDVNINPYPINPADLIE